MFDFVEISEHAKRILCASTFRSLQLWNQMKTFLEQWDGYHRKSWSNERAFRKCDIDGGNKCPNEKDSVRCACRTVTDSSICQPHFAVSVIQGPKHTTAWDEDAGEGIVLALPVMGAFLWYSRGPTGCWRLLIYWCDAQKVIDKTHAFLVDWFCVMETLSWKCGCIQQDYFVSKDISVLRSIHIRFVKAVSRLESIWA